MIIVIDTREQNPWSFRKSEHIEGTVKQEETHPEYFAQRKKLKTTRHEDSVAHG